MEFPPIGQEREAVMARLAALKQNDLDWRDGRLFALVFSAGEEAEAVIKEAYAMFMSENALDPTTFPSLLQLEREVVRMTADLMRGDEHVVGNATSGGTESIMLAVKTARDWARAERPEIDQPEMVLSQTAHAAFHKAAHYLGVKKVVVPFDPVSFQADLEAMEKAINENTILLVASAPNYSHGVVDPVPQIAALAAAHGLLCHVDACIGGLQLAFMRQLGYDVPPFDLTVPGVTSLSVDPHKYGYSAKGSSVILYRNKALRRHQIFANLSTTSYAIINPTMQSTKSGGPLAATWAMMHYFGEKGYREVAGEVAEAAKAIIAGVREIPDLKILGKPDMSIFALSSDTINAFQLADVMKRKGWYLQPQFSRSGRPSIHLTVTRANAPHVKRLLADLKTAVEETKQLDELDPAIVQGQVDMLLADLPIEEAADSLYQLAGIDGRALPRDMAFVNTVLNALPPAVSEHILGEYFNNLFV